MLARRRRGGDAGYDTDLTRAMAQARYVDPGLAEKYSLNSSARWSTPGPRRRRSRGPMSLGRRPTAPRAGTPTLVRHDVAVLCQRRKSDASAVGRALDPAPDGVPRRITEILRRGLAVRPEGRHPDMPALLAALERDPIALNLDLMLREADRALRVGMPASRASWMKAGIVMN